MYHPRPVPTLTSWCPPTMPRQGTYLFVAEKPSISKSVAGILSGGTYTTRNTANKYIKNYDFDYLNMNAHITMTAVSGHLMSHDFGEAHRRWQGCDPFELFDAPIVTQVSKVSFWELD